MSDDDVTVELDEYARTLWDAYHSASTQIRDLEALRVKARDQLYSWFSVKGARRGTIDGRHVVTYSAYDITEFDSQRFREDQPALWAAYTHPAPRRKLVAARD